MTAGLGMIAGLGIPELLLIIVIVLIIFGPKRLPQLGSSLGKTVKNIREGMEEDDEPADDAEDVYEDDEEYEDEEDEGPIEEAEPRKRPAKRSSGPRKTTAHKAQRRGDDE